MGHEPGGAFKCACGCTKFHAKGLCHKCYQNLPYIRERHKGYMKAYLKTPKARAYRKAYYRRPEVKLKVRTYMREYARRRRHEPRLILRREQLLIQKAEKFLPRKTAVAFVLDGVLLDRREKELQREKKVEK